MADLSKILQQESEGIMFPFRTGVQSTTTEQQVYDSATDGIMTVTGQQYTLPEYKGPTATVQYGTEEQGYPRMLREIEQGELPQFRQEDFPEVGTGIMQPSTPVTQPVDTTPTTEPEAPAYDPCPPGFKYDPVQKVCVPIEQPKSDRQEVTLPEPKSLTNQARDLKGTINFDKNISATDTNLRKGQYEYQPSRKTLNPFETGGIIGTVMNGLHNIGQYFNERQAMDLGILRDNDGDGKPDTIDTVQVTRNYQEEELGLPPGARATGAELSMEEQTQYDTMKKIYEEGQISGTPTITAEKEEPKAEEEKTLKSDTGLTKEVTPRFEGGFGELMGVKEFGQLNRDVEVLGMNIDALQKSLDTITDKDELQYQIGRLDRLQRDLYDKNQKLKKEKEKRQEITDNYNKLQKQKQEEQLQQIKEGKDTRQTYDKPRTQEQRQRETGQTQKQRESGTATTGKFERAKAGASVSGERLRGGI